MNELVKSKFFSLLFVVNEIQRRRRENKQANNIYRNSLEKYEKYGEKKRNHWRDYRQFRCMTNHEWIEKIRG